MEMTTTVKLAAARRAAFLSMSFERLWPLVLPLLALVALFIAIAWFGLFQRMPGWLHIAALGVFGIAGIAALYLPTRLRLPAQAEVDRRLEAANLLTHGPISLQTDAIAAGDHDPFTSALWDEHRRRMAEKLQNLQSGMPRPHIPERDPLALRAAVALFFVTAFAYASGPEGGSLSDAFRIRLGAGGPAPRVDAWVTPPRYTGRAPVFLTAQENSGEASFTVPQGSVLAARVIGGTGREQLTETRADGTELEIPATEGGNPTTENARNFQFPLKQATEVSLSGGDAKWSFTIIPDKPPMIRFIKEPGRALNGTLELAYSIDDDHGATKGHAEIIEAERPATNARPLFHAPEVPLVLPRRGTKDATASQDITEHPWAGSQVRLTLVAQDDAGQEGRSETKTFTLPERPFANPLARAVVEQRRMLALDANSQDQVLDMLSAITLRPEDTIRNATHYLVLRSVQSRLKLARNDDQLRDVAAYMWQVALGIEDGQLSDAEKRLRQAQEALKQAIQNGASPEEIEKLMAELRQAMQQFLKEYAKRQQQSPYAAPMDPNARVLTQKDLDRMMEQIENLAKQGSRDSAEQLLSQLENMMNNLQMGQSQQGRQGQQGQDPMRQQMNKLSDIMRRQQETMNETSRLNREMQEQEGSEVPDAGKSQELAEAMRKLQQGQGQLQSELNEMMNGLKGMGLEPGKEMGEAGQSMGRAGEALGRAEGGEATDQQSNALDALRRGAREMMKQMQEAMGQGGSGGRPGQQSPGGRDPLGRSIGQDDSVKIPNGTDIQRARQILEEIRRRLGNSLSPQLEKEYLERLLKFD
nr:TIGR02302 family protein [Phyllobacterium leguminum]